MLPDTFKAAPKVAGKSMCIPIDPDINSVLYKPTAVTEPLQATGAPKVEVPTLWKVVEELMGALNFELPVNVIVSAGAFPKVVLPKNSAATPLITVNWPANVVAPDTSNVLPRTVAPTV
jgi:hypothetical protein